MDKFKARITEKIMFFVLDYHELIIVLLTIIVMVLTGLSVKQSNQIQTQKEYIQCLENENWEQFVELEHYKENEFRRVEEE